MISVDMGIGTPFVTLTAVCPVCGKIVTVTRIDTSQLDVDVIEQSARSDGERIFEHLEACVSTR